MIKSKLFCHKFLPLFFFLFWPLILSVAAVVITIYKKYNYNFVLCLHFYFINYQWQNNIYIYNNVNIKKIFKHIILKFWYISYIPINYWQIDEYHTRLLLFLNNKETCSQSKYIEQNSTMMY